MLINVNFLRIAAVMGGGVIYWLSIGYGFCDGFLADGTARIGVRCKGWGYLRMEPQE